MVPLIYDTPCTESSEAVTQYAAETILRQPRESPRAVISGRERKMNRAVQERASSCGLPRPCVGAVSRWERCSRGSTYCTPADNAGSYAMLRSSERRESVCPAALKDETVVRHAPPSRQRSLYERTDSVSRRCCVAQKRRRHALESLSVTVVEAHFNAALIHSAAT